MAKVRYNLWLRTQDLTWRGVPFQPNLIIWPFRILSVAHPGRAFSPHEKLAMICHEARFAEQPEESHCPSFGNYGAITTLYLHILLRQ